MKLNELKITRLAAVGGLSMLVVCATIARADGGAGEGFYLGTDAGLNILEGNKNVRTEPGVRWDLEGGYGFKLSPQLTLAPELEAGWIYNNLRHTGEINQIPLLCNFVLNAHLGKWVPYFGLGGGGDIINASSGKGGGYSNMDLALQAQAGVRYMVTDHFDVGVGYKYLVDFLEHRGETASDNSFLLSASYHF